MFTQWKLQASLIAIGAVLATLAAAFLGEPVAYAQGEEGGYADVGLILEAPEDPTAGGTHDLNVIVVNKGTRTAYDVEVVVDVEYPAKSLFHPDEVPGMVRQVGTVSSVDGTLHWAIPALWGGQREELNAQVTHKRSNPAFENTDYTHELSGKVTTASYDSDLSNNTARIWTYKYHVSSDNYRQVWGNYSVNVSVDNTAPAPGEVVNFTITAGRTNPYSISQGRYRTPPPVDLKVDIELTGGLTIDDKGTITYAPTDNRADSVSYSNGVFTIGTLNLGEDRVNSVSLPITVAANAAGSQQCLTATLTGNPPPGTGPYDDYVSDNVAKL